MPKLEAEWHTNHITSAVETLAGSKKHHKQELMKLMEELDRRKGVRMGEILEAYREKVAHPKTTRTVRRYMIELIEEDEIMWRGQKSSRRYKIS